MTNESLVTCPNCGRRIIPRLWHRRVAFSYMRTQHICPFCGVCMYTTGGQLNRRYFAVFLFAVVVAPTLFFMSALVCQILKPPVVVQQPVPQRRGLVLPPALLDEYAGYYELPGYYMTFVRYEGDDRLYLTNSSGELTALSREEFATQSGNERIRFERGAGGKITHVTFTRKSGEQERGKKL